MTTTVMLKANLESAPRTVHGGISKQSVTLGGVTATRVRFAPGARWSTELAHKAGTASCTAPHVAYVLSGVVTIRMDDGALEEFGPGDVMILPAGHDAWTVGVEPCVFVEFSRGYDELGLPAPVAATARLG